MPVSPGHTDDLSIRSGTCTNKLETWKQLATRIETRSGDVSQELLATGTPTAQLAFFQDVGAAEAACMCFAITIASTNSSTPPSTSARAEQLLSDPRFVGAPEWPVEGDNAAPYGVVTDNLELDWSQMHRGLALLLFRLLGRVWELPLLRPTARAGGGAAAGAAAPVGGGAVELALPAETLAALQEQLQDVAAVALRVVEAMQVHLTNRRVTGGVEGEYEDDGGPSKRRRQEPAVLVEGGKVTAMRCARASVALLFPCAWLRHSWLHARAPSSDTVHAHNSQEHVVGASADTTTSHGMQQARRHGSRGATAGAQA